ncbi:hypothetical protein AAF712_015934 [Marasmius tenuissimus]|uniref:Uncharacterized protein n=1 Tax=Marasmius tenuissimus TaxID=585030 RepID=A0ABR2Z817_9AGAR
MFDLKKHFGNKLFDGSTVTFMPKYKPTMESVTKAAGLYETLIDKEKDTPYPQGITSSVTTNTGDNAVTESIRLPPSQEQIAEWHVDCAGWKKNNNILMGYFQLTITASTFDQFKNMKACDAWALMCKKYSQPTLSTIYGDFLKAVTFTLNQQNPLGSIAKLHQYFECLESIGVELSELIKALILVQAIPKTWEVAASKCFHNYGHEEKSDESDDEDNSTAEDSKNPLTFNRV